SALEFIQTNEVSLAVLDVMMPGLDGFELLQAIRQHYFFPVLMLTAKGEDLDKITGLTLGADDYITKPFNPLEVVARVKTQLRRFKRYNLANQATVTEEEFAKDGLVLIKNSHKVFLNEREILITPLEFKILQHLFEN